MRLPYASGRIIVPRLGGSIAVLIAIYAAVMIAAILLMPHDLDWLVFKWLGSHVEPRFSQNISIVDVAWDPSDVPSNRRRIADFINGLVRSEHRPNAVILDVEFDPCQAKPCGAPMAAARDLLVASIRRATRFFPVYATEEPAIGQNDAVSGPVDRHDALIYGVVSGAGHTHFTSTPNVEGSFYRICYPDVPFVNESGESQGTENIWAMTARVLMSPRDFANSPACDSNHIPVRFGPSLTPRALYRFTDARVFSGYSQFDAKMFVIVGTIKYDQSPFADRSGPELLGWALSNALDQGSLLSKEPYYDAQPQNTMLLLLLPVFSGLAVLAYVAAFFQLKRVRLGKLRPLMPWLAFAIASAAGLAIFAAFEIWMFSSHHIQPQVSLISLGILTASGLSGLRGVQVLFEEENALQSRGVEAYDYDVFISYAHEDGAWVSEHVYAPFRSASLADGRKLSIFFDTSSIRSGTAWQSTLALAIDGSRFVVPVYSETYFKQPYCRFEIMRAHRKWVLAGGESRCVLPIMRGHPKIYPAVDDIQALSFDDHPNLVRQHIAEITAQLFLEVPSKDSPQEGAGE